MSQYPVQGLVPYDQPLKAYIDGQDAATASDANAYTDAQIADTNATIDTAVAEAVEGRVPGMELGYSERATATPYTATANANITELTMTVTGTGGPVEVEFWCPAWAFSAAGNIQCLLNVDGVLIGSGTRAIVAGTVNTFLPLSVRARTILSAGDHTVTVGHLQSVAGTIQFYNDNLGRRTWLSVVGR